MMRQLTAAALACALALAPAAALTQAAPADAPAPDPATRAAALREAARLLGENYVFADKGRAMEAALNAEAEALAAPPSEAEFLKAVNARLFAMSNDRHLRLGPPGAMPSGGPTMRRVRLPGPGPAAGAQPVERGPAERGGLEDEVPGRNVEVEWRWLEPGVGYLRASPLHLTPSAKAKFDAAFAAFQGAGAVVIDLRGTPGGTDIAVRYIASHFFPEPVLLSAREGRHMPRSELRSEVLESGLKGDVKLYLLVGPRTASAAESLAFALKRTGRAVLVGETTAGAGHWGGVERLPGGYVMFLPRGRTFDPTTGQGWETVGVQPQVQVPVDQALERALDEIRRAAAARAA